MGERGGSCETESHGQTRSLVNRPLRRLTADSRVKGIRTPTTDVGEDGRGWDSRASTSRFLSVDPTHVPVGRMLTPFRDTGPTERTTRTAKAPGDDPTETDGVEDPHLPSKVKPPLGPPWSQPSDRPVDSPEFFVYERVSGDGGPGTRGGPQAPEAGVGVFPKGSTLGTPQRWVQSRLRSTSPEAPAPVEDRGAS